MLALGGMTSHLPLKWWWHSIDVVGAAVSETDCTPALIGVELFIRPGIARFCSACFANEHRKTHESLRLSSSRPTASGLLQGANFLFLQWELAGRSKLMNARVYGACQSTAFENCE